MEAFVLHLTGKKSNVGQCHVHCTHGRCVSAQLLCLGSAGVRGAQAQPCFQAESAVPNFALQVGVPQ